MLLIERLIEKGRIVESDRTKLPDGVLCRVVYPVCNFGQVNANHRMYEAAVWEHVLKDPELKEKLEKRSLFGHAEHPQGSASDLQLTSHVIHEMKVDGDKVYQTIDVVDTPTGRIVDCLLRAECTVGVSTRAEGELEEAESKALGKYQRVIPEKYVYITTDFTADPSTANMAPVEVRRNIVKAAESVLSETKASLGDKRFGRAVIESIACKSSKCDGSGCGACKALKKIKEGDQFSYKEIADEVCVSVPFVDHKEVEQAAMELISDLAHPDEVNPEDVVFALVSHFKLFGKRKKKADKMIKPEAFNPENVTGEYARESKKTNETVEMLDVVALAGMTVKDHLSVEYSVQDLESVFGSMISKDESWSGKIEGRPFLLCHDEGKEEGGEGGWEIWTTDKQTAEDVMDYIELELSSKKELFPINKSGKSAELKPTMKSKMESKKTNETVEMLEEPEPFPEEEVSTLTIRDGFPEGTYQREIEAVFGKPQKFRNSDIWYGLIDKHKFAISGKDGGFEVWAPSMGVSDGVRDYFELEKSSFEDIAEPQMESKMIHKMKIQAKVSEAVHNAELQTALEAVDDLNRTYTDASQSFRIGLKIANESANKVMGLQSQTIKAEQVRDAQNKILESAKRTHRIAAKALKESQTEVRGLTSQLHDVTAELEAIKVQHAAIQTQLEGLKKEHEAELKQIAEHNTSEISAQGIRTYAQFKIRNSGLILTESTRALLDDCKSEEEVDQVYKKIVDALRDDALHQNLPQVLQIREKEQKKVDPKTAQVYAVVKGMFSGT